MNKNDIKLTIILLFPVICTIILLNVFQKNSTIAKVYYDSKLVLTIDLSVDDEYIVTGYNGDVKIEVKNNKIRVVEENSPKHLCSKQGFVDSSTESIICLPNKIVIELECENDSLDGVVR